MTKLAALIEELKALDYPETMKPINCTITGLGFFPGGNGGYKNDACISTKDVMVLGQDFGTAEYLKGVAEGESETQSATWRNILKFLNDCGIEPTSCFYTNAIMGVRNSDLNNGKQKFKMTGKSPAFKNELFLRQCQELFLKQLDLQQPKLVLVLGKETAHFLSPLSPDLDLWKKLGTFSDIDGKGIHTINAKFDNGIRTTFILLTHPSFRNSNVTRRKFGNVVGDEAEKAMVLAAMR